MKKTPTDIHWLKIDAQPVKAGENGHPAPSEFPYRMTTDSLECFEFCVRKYPHLVFRRFSITFYFVRKKEVPIRWNLVKPLCLSFSNINRLKLFIPER